MAIKVDDDKKIFYLQAKSMSYIFQIVDGKYPVNLHFGKKVEQIRNVDNIKCMVGAPLMALNESGIAVESLRCEYPLYGHPDMRTPALHIQYEDGSSVTELEYVDYLISNGKRKPEGLPATYVEDETEAQSLEIRFIDKLKNITVILTYCVYENFNAITRFTKIINNSDANADIKSVMSASIDIHNDNYDIIHLDGAWGRERHITRTKIVSGFSGIDSKRGSSSHHHNPFLAIAQHNADEQCGEVYGFSLVYSGNFLACAELDQQDFVRVMLGINPFDFNWRLKPNESFYTPEAVMVFSDDGIGEMSRTYHKLYRTRLCRGPYRDSIRPILINNWQATYFNFNEEKIVDIAKSAKKVGLDMVVLDDGWFGCRNNDKTSLGDWTEDTTKLPNGISHLAKRISDMGMKFGLWFEPEMVSPVSKLYDAHPDWCLHVGGRSCSTGRNQLILDFSRNEVCEYIIKCISDILSNAPISYIKWDMNRNMTEIGSAILPPERQRETAHRYILGVYKTIETIINKFPDLLVESCSAGGGRFDPGMLYYSPQIWTSDDTDSVERLYIQYGTSIVYPTSCIGAHVSDVPNHQVKRVTPLKMRGDIAMAGMLGYELDLSRLSNDELAQMHEQTVLYRKIQHTITFGDMYRIKSPFEGNSAAFQYISEDKNQIVLIYSNILRHANDSYENIRFCGLEDDAEYQEVNTDEVYLGAQLMNVGINFRNTGDFQSKVMLFQKKQ